MNLCLAILAKVIALWPCHANEWQAWCLVCTKVDLNGMWACFEFHSWLKCALCMAIVKPKNAFFVLRSAGQPLWCWFLFWRPVQFVLHCPTVIKMASWTRNAWPAWPGELLGHATANTQCVCLGVHQACLCSRVQFSGWMDGLVVSKKFCPPRKSASSCYDKSWRMLLLLTASFFWLLLAKHHAD